MKWLDPKTNPIPKDKIVLAYVKRYHFEVSRETTIVCLEPLNDGSGYTYGVSSHHWPNGIDEEDIIGWIPLKIPKLTKL